MLRTREIAERLGVKPARAAKIARRRGWPCEIRRGRTADGQVERVALWTVTDAELTDAAEVERARPAPPAPVDRSSPKPRPKPKRKPKSKPRVPAGPALDPVADAVARETGDRPPRPEGDAQPRPTRKGPQLDGEGEGDVGGAARPVLWPWLAGGLIVAALGVGLAVALSARSEPVPARTSNPEASPATEPPVRDESGGLRVSHWHGIGGMQ